MAQSDPIADMLTRMRNAVMAKLPIVDVPASKMKKRILEIFKEYGYIEDFELLEDNKQGILRITLRYIEEEPVFKELKRISKPGRRQYVSLDDVPNVKRGMGIAVISTSKGIMTNKEAKKQGVGGEYICYVY